MTALVMNVNIVQWMNGNQKNKTKKLQNAFLRPSFPGHILDCTALLHFVHHAPYNLRICPCQSRREEIILEFRFYDSL